MYVKHKIYDKYGSIIDDNFIEHKWVKKNEKEYEKRKKLLKEHPNMRLPGLIIGEFVHLIPQKIDKNFFDHFKIISYEEYLTCVTLF